MDAMTALRSMMVTEELKPAGDEVGQERKPFSGWKVKIEYEATDSDGQSYRSEYWFIMDKEAQCVIRSFDTLSRILCKWKQDSVVSLFLYDNGQNCFFTQSCPFHYFLFCICYGMNASIISVGLPSSVNAPRRYLLGLHSGSQ